MKTYTLKQINEALYHNEFYGSYFKSNMEVSKFMDTLVEALEYQEEMKNMLTNTKKEERLNI